MSKSPHTRVYLLSTECDKSALHLEQQHLTGINFAAKTLGDQRPPTAGHSTLLYLSFVRLKTLGANASLAKYLRDLKTSDFGEFVKPSVALSS